MITSFRITGRLQLVLVVVAVLAQALSAAPVVAQVTAFKQAVAEMASSDRDLAEFYRSGDYQPVWTGEGDVDRTRRQALFQAIANAGAHGLPTERYGADELMAQLRAVRSHRDRGLAEVAMSRTFLQLARDMQTGALTPSKVVPGNKREVAYRDEGETLRRLMRAEPNVFFKSLAPRSNEYARLMREKARLERLMGAGGWGAQVPVQSLRPGNAGEAVVALRNRLSTMGYMGRSVAATYDAELQKAVQRFQVDHGLLDDGVAGPGTMRQINVTVEGRLESILVSLERERWFNIERGERHILVNLTDFSARIMDNDELTFQTRTVIGKNQSGRRSPEFSDKMDHMVINPTWNVPRSIATKEYLPMMKRNRNAASHLRLYDRRGRQVSRANINFGAYNARNFPYAIKQPPSSRNALGLVKFMFPNKYNIYLHDTPSKSLFKRESRAFSHGCIRLQKPFEFAYVLLSRQEADPKAFFHAKLRTGRETRVALEREVPVHIIYRTAFTDPKGRAQYRADIYGRDARIWNALQKAGVSLNAVQG